MTACMRKASGSVNVVEDAVDDDHIEVVIDVDVREAPAVEFDVSLGGLP